MQLFTLGVNPAELMPLEMVKPMENVGEMGQAVTEGGKVGESAAAPAESAKPAAEPSKPVPNPNGRNGGPEHQETVKQEEQKIIKQGLEPEREFRVKTPGGNKENRYIDLVGKNKETGKVEVMKQIGRQTQKGQPVAREGRALDDVEKATGTRPDFVPYNTLPPP